MPLFKPSRRARAAGRAAAAFAPAGSSIDRLADFPPPRDNPGKLKARIHVPPGSSKPAPLIVVLHGCTQNAAAYDHGSGWSTLADRHGFILLFPEQDRANNPMLCFNWFAANDSRRGMGEAASIRSMIAAVGKAHAIDPARIFVTGLSAGGAMAAVMLATYPEIFAGGAIIAGVAYGCASGVQDAFDCMGGRAGSDAAELASRVRRASPHQGPWPRIQIWQGSADDTVVPSNGDAIALQWAQLHGLGPRPDRTDRVAGHPRRVWTGPGGRAAIEQYVIAGMGHGVPLDPGAGEDALGAAGPHMLDVGLSSTARIAAFFGVAPEPGVEDERVVEAGPGPARAPISAGRSGKARAARTEPASGVQSVIEKALQAAGLMR